MNRRDVLRRLVVALGMSLQACKGGVEPPVGGNPEWPNEPGGLTLISDYGFEDVLPVGVNAAVDSQWFINNAGLASRVLDTSAPASASFVGQWSYPVGFAGGDDPATMYGMVGGGNEMYIGFYWKVSNPWQDHPVANKIAFQFAGGGGAGGQTFIALESGSHILVPTLEFSTDFARNLEPNVDSTVVTLGVWHRIEWYMNKSTGTMKWWLDGVLQGHYTNVNYPPEPFDEFKFAPTWGGTGGTKSEQDYFWYDHVRLSNR